MHEDKLVNTSERTSKWIIIRMIAGTVEGDQTVPRAELTAIKQTLMAKQEDGTPIVTDHQNIVNHIQSDSSRLSNWDIWGEIRRLHKGEQIFKIKSHDHESARIGRSDPLHYFANEIADELADEAAAEVQIDEETARTYSQEKIWAQQVRRRITHINKHIYERHQREQITREKEKMERDRKSQE